MKNDKIITFKYYPILLSLVVSIQMICFFLSRRQIDLFGLTVNGSGLLFPLDIYLFEIIGYCYGYEYSRQAVWTNIGVHFLFFGIFFIIQKLPYASQMHSEIVKSYDTLFKFSFWMILGSILGEFLGDFFSAFVVPKSKLKLHGKFAGLIIFFTHLISSFLVVSVAYIITNIPEGYNWAEIFKLISGTMIIKTFIAIIMLPFAKIIIYKIKLAEGLDIYDNTNQNYSLFRFNPDFYKLRMVNFKGVYNVKKNLNNQ
jgi:uncharacterized PurR-regulated membrane protein YhhQ (DUF165 family)